MTTYMTDTWKKGIALVIAGVVIGLLVSALWGNSSFGGVYNNVTNDFSEGITVDGTTVISGSRAITGVAGTFSGDVSVSGGTLSVPTAASATSTAIVGCVQTYATSSATAIKLIFNTSASTTVLSSDTVRGTVLWAYGTCPSL